MTSFERVLSRGSFNLDLCIVKVYTSIEFHTLVLNIVWIGCNEPMPSVISTYTYDYDW